MGVVVGEGAQAVEFFLAGGVPEGELDVDVVDEYICEGWCEYAASCKALGVGMGTVDVVL